MVIMHDELLVGEEDKVQFVGAIVADALVALKLTFKLEMAELPTKLNVA